jgi:hypothetical protein
MAITTRVSSHVRNRPFYRTDEIAAITTAVESSALRRTPDVLHPRRMAHPFRPKSGPQPSRRRSTTAPATARPKDWTRPRRDGDSEEPSLDIDDDVGMISACTGPVPRCYVRMAAANEAPFVIVAKYDRWKDVIRARSIRPRRCYRQAQAGEGQPADDDQVRAGEQSLVNSATKVPTEFID